MSKMISFFLGYFFLGFKRLSEPQKYFEGKIYYRHSFKPKLVNSNINMPKRLFGSGSKLSFKEGNYRHDYRGGIFEFDIYNKTDNKLYLKKRDNETIYWIDCSLAGKKIKNSKIFPKTENVMGIDCDQIIIEYEKEVSVQYYNSDFIAIDPLWFNDFKLNGQNLIDEKVKSIFLKAENEFSDFFMIATATKINRRKIDERIFKISANSILSKID
jgi:hypothetical protein